MLQMSDTSLSCWSKAGFRHGDLPKDSLSSCGEVSQFLYSVRFSLWQNTKPFKENILSGHRWQCSMDKIISTSRFLQLATVQYVPSENIWNNLDVGKTKRKEGVRQMQFLIKLSDYKTKIFCEMTTYAPTPFSSRIDWDSEVLDSRSNHS